MRNKSQTTMYVVILLSVLVCVLLHMYVASPKKADTATLKAENDTLEIRVNKIKEYYDKMDEYKADIASMTQQILQMIQPFPADVKEEDMIMNAVATQKDENMIAFKNILIGEREEIQSIEAKVVKDAQIEGLDKELIFRKRPCEYANLTTYSSLKKAVEEIEKSNYDVAIRNIVYEYSSEKELLDGIISCDYYSAIGTGKEYQELTLKDYPRGVTDIFGSMEQKRDSQN